MFETTPQVIVKPSITEEEIKVLNKKYKALTVNERIIQLYKDLKKQNPKFNTIDFRVLQYRKFFTNL